MCTSPGVQPVPLFPREARSRAAASFQRTDSIAVADRLPAATQVGGRHTELVGIAAIQADHLEGSCTDRALRQAYRHGRLAVASLGAPPTDGGNPPAPEGTAGADATPPHAARIREITMGSLRPWRWRQRGNTRGRCGLMLTSGSLRLKTRRWQVGSGSAGRRDLPGIARKRLVLVSHREKLRKTAQPAMALRAVQVLRRQLQR